MRYRSAGLGALRWLAFALATLWVASGSLSAQPTFPDRPIRIINPFPPGSPVDFIGRFAADRIERAWGQPVVGESRSGAGGTLGAAVVARAPADGYTMLVTTPSLITATTLHRDLPYDPLRDLVPIWGVLSSGLVIVVNPVVPATTLQEFIAHVRRNPSQLSYATSGHGTTQHFGAELFLSRTALSMEHVPYRGGAPAATDLIAGHVQAMFDALSNQLPNIRDGRVRPLALMRDRRSPALPEVPTTAEAGVAGAEMPGWVGLFAPTGTPAPIRQRMIALLSAAMEEPAVRERMAGVGQEPDMTAGEEFAARVRRDASLFVDIARKAGIKPE